MGRHSFVGYGSSATQMRGISSASSLPSRLSSADAEEGINDSLDLYPSFFRAVAPLHISSKEEGQAGLLDRQEEGEEGGRGFNN